MSQVMKEYACFGSVCPNLPQGYLIHTVPKTDESFMQGNDDYFFIAYIALPEIDLDLLEAGVKKIDAEVADLLRKVEAKKLQKEKLLDSNGMT